MTVPKMRTRCTTSVVRSLNHARKVLSMHRKLPGHDRDLIGRPVRGPRLQEISDVVTDLRHLAERYRIPWHVILERVDLYHASDWED